MAPADKDRKDVFFDGDITAHPVRAGVRIFLGTLVTVDGLGLAGPAQDDAGHTFAGVACGQADNREGADCGILVTVQRRTITQFPVSTGVVTKADLRAECFVVDDQTVKLGAGNVRCGVIGKFTDALTANVDIFAAFGDSTPGPTGPAGPTGADGPIGPAGPAGSAELSFDAICLSSDAVGDAVYVTGNKSGTSLNVTKCDIDSTFDKAIPVGVITAKATATTCTVLSVGEASIWSGLTAGQVMWVQVDGSLAQSPPPLPLSGKRANIVAAYATDDTDAIIRVGDLWWRRPA